MKISTILCTLHPIFFVSVFGRSKISFFTDKFDHRAKWRVWLLSKIKEGSQPYQANIYSYRISKMKNSVQEEISREIAKFIPTKQVEVKAQRENSLCFHKPFTAKITNFIFLTLDKKYSEILNEYKKTLDQTLILIFGTSAYKKFEPFLKKLQLYTWENRFLHASFIYVDKNLRITPYISSYNPFQSTFIKKLTNQSSAELFPVKLRNIMGYKLTIGSLVYDLSPKAIAKMDSLRLNSKFLIDLQEGNYVFAKYFLSKTMNFTLVVNYEKGHDSEMFMMNYMLQAFNTSVSVAPPNNFLFLKAAIPHLKEGEIKSEYNSFYIIYYVFVSLLCSTLIKITVKVLKLDESIWRNYKCLTCLLGRPVNVGNKTKERIFYFLIIILSAYISNDL